MLPSLIATVMDTVAGVEENVDIDGLRTMYHFFWDNPNLNKRKQFRAKMIELKDEDAWGGAQRALMHLDEMANLIGVEIIVMSHGPRCDRQPDAGWQLPKTKKRTRGHRTMEKRRRRRKRRRKEGHQEKERKGTERHRGGET